MTYEIWKDIIGYEGYYQVSNYGHFKSLDRQVANPVHGICWLKGKPKKTVIVDGKYSYIKLTKDGKEKLYRAHRVVAKHFLPNPLDLPEVNHKDGNKQNNHVDNLEWCDRVFNQRHAVSTKLVVYPKGDKCKNTKILFHDVCKIREAVKNGSSYEEMALKHNVHIGHIKNIVKFKKRKFQ